MPAPFTTPVAQSIPFEPNRNPGYGGVPSGIMSDNVQDAIEEAKQDALNNDRFLLMASYNGNANAGRYLEFFNNIDSLIAPILFTAESKVIDIVAATTAASATCTIQFVDVAPTTPIVLYTLTFSNQKRVIDDGLPESPLFTIPANTRLGIRIGTGSINRPHLYFYVSTST